MFCLMHNFLSKTLLLNLCHCYLKCKKTLVTFSLTLIRKVRILDITKLLRNVHVRKNLHANGLITYVLRGLLFNTEDMKKRQKVQVTQQNEILSLHSTALGFINKYEEYKLENKV